MVDNIRELINNCSSYVIDQIKTGILEIIKWGALGIIDNSFYFCLIASLIALLLYIAGQKKAGKYVTTIFIIYFILQALGVAIRSV